MLDMGAHRQQARIEEEEEKRRPGIILSPDRASLVTAPHQINRNADIKRREERAVHSYLLMQPFINHFIGTLPSSQ